MYKSYSGSIKNLSLLGKRVDICVKPIDRCQWPLKSIS